jgi:hypothetical protein
MSSRAEVSAAEGSTRSDAPNPSPYRRCPPSVGPSPEWRGWRSAPGEVGEEGRELSSGQVRDIQESDSLAEAHDFGRDSVHPFPARMAASIALEVVSESKTPIRVLDPMMVPEQSWLWHVPRAIDRLGWTSIRLPF